jgi:hypothetical protein
MACLKTANFVLFQAYALCGITAWGRFSCKEKLLLFKEKLFVVKIIVLKRVVQNYLLIKAFYLIEELIKDDPLGQT